MFHDQANRLDSVWALDVGAQDPHARRLIALGRDPVGRASRRGRLRADGLPRFERRDVGRGPARHSRSFRRCAPAVAAAASARLRSRLVLPAQLQQDSAGALVRDRTARREPHLRNRPARLVSRQFPRVGVRIIPTLEEFHLPQFLSSIFTERTIIGIIALLSSTVRPTAGPSPAGEWRLPVTSTR
jgi:hypothetical protein